MDEMRPYKTEGEKLQALLQTHGMNQSELSRRLNLTDAAVSKWLSGRTAPSRFNRKRMEHMFNLPAGYFDEPDESESYSPKTISTLTLISKAMDLRKVDKISEETLLELLHKFGG